MSRRIPRGCPIVTAEAMRAAEAAVFARGVSQAALMERAGVAIAVQVARLAAGRPVLVLAGPGNNGGDARVVARWLAERGHDVTLASDPPDAEPRAVLVDGLFGIGLSRPLADPAPLRRLRDAAELTVAIDLPSGVGCDDGADFGAAGADVSVALGALKPAHLLSALCGRVVLADIGVPVPDSWRTIAQPRIASPGASAHKYTRGLVAVVGGAMPGAARLAARAAMRGGAGYVTLDGAGGPDALVHREPDARAGAIVCGPGLGSDSAARGALDRVLALGRPTVLDGDALALIDPAKLAGTIVTPHSGEFDRLFGTGGGGKIARTVAAARAHGCTIVHKGAATVIAHPDGRATVAADAPGWLASAGTGDVLAGLVGARLAAGAEQAAEEAVWLHTRAAQLAGPALIADDLIDRLPQAVSECR